MIASSKYLGIGFPPLLNNLLLICFYMLNTLTQSQENILEYHYFSKIHLDLFNCPIFFQFLLGFITIAINNLSFLLTNDIFDD